MHNGHGGSDLGHGLHHFWSPLSARAPHIIAKISFDFPKFTTTVLYNKCCRSGTGIRTRVSRREWTPLLFGPPVQFWLFTLCHDWTPRSNSDRSQIMLISINRLPSFLGLPLFSLTILTPCSCNAFPTLALDFVRARASCRIIAFLFYISVRNGYSFANADERFCHIRRELYVK